MPDPRHREAGFSLLEIAVVGAIILIVSLIGFPAFFRILERQQLTGAAKEVAVLMRLARMEAIKGNAPTGVTVDFQSKQVIAFIERDDPAEAEFGVFSDDDREVGRTSLPANIEMQGPTDAAPGGDKACVGFAENGEGEGTVLFRSNGSADESGAFRLKGRAENYIEVRVDPRATGRVAVRKWFGGDEAVETNWLSQGENDRSWQWYEDGETPAGP